MVRYFENQTFIEQSQVDWQSCGGLKLEERKWRHDVFRSNREQVIVEPLVLDHFTEESPLCFVAGLQSTVNSEIVLDNKTAENILKKKIF